MAEGGVAQNINYHVKSWWRHGSIYEWKRALCGKGMTEDQDTTIGILIVGGRRPKNGEGRGGSERIKSRSMEGIKPSGSSRNR